MKILFTGGGTGGHFYPIIAVAEEITDLVKENRLIPPEMFFMSPNPYDAAMLYDKGITFKKTSAGKIRRYRSIQNFFDIFKTGWGMLTALFSVFSLYPDVVFGKGGYTSFPVLCAARILRIPVIIHESDTVPGKVNMWAGKFATKIAVSYPETLEKFPAEKVALTGNPVRKELMEPLREAAHDFFKLTPNIPTVFVVGGSQGAQLINDTLIDALPELLTNCHIIHQTGPVNHKDVVSRTDAALLNHPFKDRYKPLPYLDTLTMRMAAGAADVIVSRAGSTIFEIAIWGVPSILIPITETNGDHQRKNAYAYARAKACVVVEEQNFSSHILISEIRRILGNPETRTSMKAAALAFGKRDAARTIAKEILAIALSHEEA